MKKLSIYLSIVIILFAALFIIERQSNKSTLSANSEAAMKLYNTTPDKLDPATVKQLSNPDYQNIILPDELQQKLDNGEDLFVYFFSPTCSYCVATTPHLNEIAAEVGVDIFQFNNLEFGQIASQYGVRSTPTLVFFENGQLGGEDTRIVGGMTGDDSAQDEIVKETYTSFLAHYKQ